MIWPLVLIVGLLTAIWLRWRRKNSRLLEVSKKFNGPKTIPFLGNALKFMCQPEELVTIIKDLIARYGDVVRFWLGPDLNFVVSNPDDLKVLLTNMKISVKGPQYKYMADVIGGGILSGSGPSWRKHRKIATPNYGKKAIESYSRAFNEEVDLLLMRYEQAPLGQMWDIYQDVVKTTSYSVCQTLLGLSKEQTMSLPYLQDIINQTPEIYDLVFDRMTKWYLQIDPIFWLTSSYRFQRNFLKMIADFSRTTLQHRMENLMTLTEKHKVNLMDPEEDILGNTELSVIDRFILSQELDEEELSKETFTIFTSSQEASAKIASFILLMMAYHPECQDKLYSEIRAVTGAEDRWITDEDLKMMPYLDMVFKEVLRLFPIGAMLQRSINEDISISSGTLPAGCSLVAPIYHIHRDSRFWNNPDAFDPDRFSLENSRLRHPNCYIPFSLGPMDCLESARQVESMVRELSDASLKIGLELNTSKTKVMTNNSLIPITTCNTTLEYVEEYIYLGKLMSFKKTRHTEEIQRRLTSSWGKFWSMKEILKSNLPMNLKKKILDSCIMPCLTYGCQTWIFNQHTRDKIEKCQRAMERSILKIKLNDKIKSSEIRKQTELIDMLQQAQKLKWRWAGHLARTTDNRWTKLTTQWQGPCGTRAKGRPQKRWVDEVKTIGGRLWQQKAQDRDEWVALEEAFTRRGVLNFT